MKKLSLLIAITTLISFNYNAQTWNLEWSDEFNGTSLDATNWSYDVGTGAAQGLNGWGNNELQYYRSGTNNVTVSGGTLKITAKQETFGGQNYTSGRIKTANQHAWTHGKIEASIKLPIGQGIWPAFWMLRDDPLADPNAQFFWPGEIDVMEIIGSQPSTLHGTAHYGVPGAVLSNGGSKSLSSGTFADDFHTFTVEWFNDIIIWKLDGVQYHQMTKSQINPNYWLFDQDYHILLNVAVGGNWPGSPDGSTVFPNTMEVDWVRVYNLANATVSATFNVDMNCWNGSDANIETGSGQTSFTTVGLESPEFGWCGGCAPMDDTDGDGIWSITVDIPTGPFEYKYSINDFMGQEQLVDDANGTGTCAPITDGSTFANRQLLVTAGVVVNDTYGSCQPCSPSANPTLTLKVDVSGEGLGAGASMYWNSNVNGWCGTCAPMTDLGNGIWEIVIDQTLEGYADGVWEYEFIIDDGQGTLIGEDLDQFEDAACTIGGPPFVNRAVTMSGVSVDMGTVCWEQCTNVCSDPTIGCTDPLANNFSSTATTDDGSCQYDVVFEVDMTPYTLGFITPAVEGDFAGWCGQCIPLADADGDNIWTSDPVSLPAGDIQFKFAVDTWADQENLDPALSCTFTDGAYTNRIFTVTGPHTYTTPWNACPMNCPEDITGDGMIDVDDFLALNSEFGNSCTCAADITGDGVVDVDDFLALNSAFGTTCP